jgi:ArsR family transcriptional regulator, arsenate/arsenite/antimonite-responsive transcriptional repressor
MDSYSCCLSNDNEFKKIDKFSTLMKLIGENNRLRILCILRQGKHCVCEINDHIAVSQSLISHHLKDLKEGGLIKDQKKGLNVYYSLTSEGKKITKLIFKFPLVEVVNK